jgi:flavin-binding protein dodecin
MVMAILKVIEILAESPTSWEDAANQAVKEAGETVRGIRSIYVENFQATVQDGKIDSFRINAKVSFAVEK